MNTSYHPTGCLHDNGMNGRPLPAPQQLQLEWHNYARWAVAPLMSYEKFRSEWLEYHMCGDEL